MKRGAQLGCRLSPENAFNWILLLLCWKQDQGEGVWRCLGMGKSQVLHGERCDPDCLWLPLPDAIWSSLCACLGVCVPWQP